jgi:hypothetical protein
MTVCPIDTYRRQIEKELQAGNATEHTHRPALKTLIESLASGVTATNEPKRVECGAPDFAVTEKRAHGPVTIGHLEAKDVGKDLGEVEKSDQMKRYLPALPNLILTDYLEFRWYVNGEHRQLARLARVGKGGKLAPEKDGAEAVTDLLSAFLSRKAEPINDPKTLALRMARLTHFIRDMIVTAFEAKVASVTLRDLHRAFEKALIPDLPIPQFADMFAQTLAYGLFAARVNHHGPPGTFKRLGAASEIPKTNPFLRQLFETITGTALDDEPFAGFVDDLAQLLADTDIGAVLADFGKRTARQDPVVHFYETFLAAYDPKVRETRGVYYTPLPVVSYIVRSVDYLLKTRFGCANGLADTATVEYEREEVDGGKPRKVKASSPRVLILDPACGTGTFLYSVIDHIRDEFMRRENAGMWSGYVRNHLLPRIFGFELLMAPYAVAHFKLGMELAGHDLTFALREKWAYDFSGDERLGVYLTNTLEEAERRAETLFGPLRVISQEANAALKIKSELPILAVIGNPPYSGHSANRSEVEHVLKPGDTYTVVSGGPLPEQRVTKTRKAHKEMKVRERTFIGRLVQDYYFVDGRPLGEKNPKWLQDDYVKFIRWGQWRIERTGAGILALITNHGYLDNPTFRGMRQSLINAFTAIYVLNLHGNSKKKERAPDGSPDENVFDIQQGVTLGIFVKEPNKAGPAKVSHADLWGLREKKYEFLSASDIAANRWTCLSPEPPQYLFAPRRAEGGGEYNVWPGLQESMLVNVLGFQTHRDGVAVAFNEEELLAQVKDYLGSAPTKENWEKYVRPCWYRPFDRRVVYLGKEVTDRPRLEVIQNLFDENVALNLVRQTRADRWGHALVCRFPTPAVFLEVKDGSSIFPLYCYHDPCEYLKAKEGSAWVPLLPWPEGYLGRRPNFNRNLIGHLGDSLGLQFVTEGKGDLRQTFGPDDVLSYVYAILYSRTYRTRYAEFLKSDFPRIPSTSDRELFRSLCGFGAELVALHLLESPTLCKPIARYPVTGPSVVEKGFPKYLAPGQPDPSVGAPLTAGRVYISKPDAESGAKGQYFEGISPEVWNFYIGGYQVCEKWLKDRRGRTLTYDDLEHYCKVVTALSETIRLMAEIDAAISKWPIE